MKHLVIVGPTASGKTELSLRLAHYFGSEIIAADSRTVYKGMDIGTAKPTTDERRGIKNYCLDLVEPNQPFTAADFKREAMRARNIINRSGKLDITVGGSGLFIDGFIYDFSFNPPNVMVRQKYDSWDVDALQAEITKKMLPMPENSKNKRHLLLALEREGLPIPTKNKLSKDTVIVGILPPKEELLLRIEHRAKAMLANGVIDEVKNLYLTYGADTAAFRGGPYSALKEHIVYGTTMQAALNALIMYDKKLAKRQITWFKRNKDIKWFNSIDEAEAWCIRIDTDYAHN